MKTTKVYVLFILIVMTIVFLFFSISSFGARHSEWYLPFGFVPHTDIHTHALLPCVQDFSPLFRRPHPHQMCTALCWIFLRFRFRFFSSFHLIIFAQPRSSYKKRWRKKDEARDRAREQVSLWLDVNLHKSDACVSNQIEIRTQIDEIQRTPTLKLVRIEWMWKLIWFEFEFHEVPNEGKKTQDATESMWEISGGKEVARWKRFSKF